MQNVYSRIHSLTHLFIHPQALCVCVGRSVFNFLIACLIRLSAKGQILGGWIWDWLNPRVSELLPWVLLLPSAPAATPELQGLRLHATLV